MGVNSTIQPILIYGANSVFKAHVFVLELLHHLLGFLLLIHMTGLQRLAHLLKNPAVHFEPAENFGELLLKSLLPHILAAACSRLANAPGSMSGAVIVNQPFLLDFCGYRTSAFGTSQQSRKHKIMPPVYVCAVSALFQDALDPVPQFRIYDWLVLPLINFAIPIKLADINPVVQNIGNGAGRDWCVAFSVSKTGCPYIRGNRFEGSVPFGIPFENLLYHRCPFFIKDNHLATFRIRDILITKRCLSRIDALFRFFADSLAGFFGEIFRILLGHQNLDAEHEFCR
ncbi:MAG: hypothetical protein OXF05_02795 [Hyphomicrobiales bacterium]|nr:hypothetical protein [Hyphomicrobiales bacterium]